MWVLFAELLAPMALAFVVGSALAWVVLAVVLPPRRPESPSATGGSR